ncbi:hypothetical protein MIR94_21525 [Vibrio parahaemolyticus]|nr:hypothetical protein [Vibrio parahaemolyticus]MCG7823996.1 hypothetical protein [Vibrio parahaemolyticus]
MLTTNVIAIDLAKNVLQICYISVHGELLFNKAFSRQKAKEFIINAKPSIVATEGCCRCHYWGQLAQEHGHGQCFVMRQLTSRFYLMVINLIFAK